ncbi:hypothetical protein ABS71_15065 [bacterium SCN 62-11]|nr:MAG: hypothetical protein ABS71_15065 [bacterium SCN 62-11]
MSSRLREGIKITALRLTRLPVLAWLLAFYYRLAPRFLLLMLPGRYGLLLRGSYVSGRLVPGLSDLDSEVIVEPGPDLTRQVQTVHRCFGRVRLLFPFLQDPFVRTWDEFLFCRGQQHEWLLYSQWSVKRGHHSLPAPAADQLLPLLRLCLRELTKNLPMGFFSSPPPGRPGQARLNPDRLALLKRLCSLLSVESDYLKELTELSLHLQKAGYLTRQARPLLGRATVAYLRVLEKALGRGEAGTAQQLLSSGGCRFHQSKLYLLAGEDQDATLLERWLELAQNWQRPAPEWSLSYEMPILFSRRLLPLAHLGFGSCFESDWLRAQGLPLESPYRREALARELADGVYLVRKKMPRRRSFLLYLQDYLVGVYPALALAWDHDFACATPEQACAEYCRRYDDALSRRLGPWLNGDLQRNSWAGVQADPLRDLQLLEDIQRKLAVRHGGP